MYVELDELFSYLTHKDRYRVVCRYVLGFSTRQIAAMENVTTEAVRVSILKAEKRLKDMNRNDKVVERIIRIFDNACF